jgi:hypothetical protein
MGNLNFKTAETAARIYADQLEPSDRNAKRMNVEIE